MKCPVRCSSNREVPTSGLNVMQCCKGCNYMCGNERKSLVFTVEESVFNSKRQRIMSTMTQLISTVKHLFHSIFLILHKAVFEVVKLDINLIMSSLSKINAILTCGAS